MSKISRAPHSLEELKEELKNRKLNTEYFNVFEEKYKQVINEDIEQYNDWTDEELIEEKEENGYSFQDSSLRYCLDFYIIFLNQIENGFSSEWCIAFANESIQEEHKIEDKCIYATFNNIRFQQYQVAISNLNHYLDRQSLSTRQKNFYLSQVEVLVDDEISEPSILDRTHEYLKTFNQKVSQGKSDIYSHYYSYGTHSFAYPELWSQAYAYSAELKINDGIIPEDAEKYAYHYADMIFEKELPPEGFENDENSEYFEICLNELLEAHPSIKNLRSQ